MTNLTLSKPVKFDNVDGSKTWFVYIIGPEGVTGQAGKGSSLKEAAENAQAKIDIMLQIEEQDQ